jgi:phosphoadenosine phosphosulfate reductase
MSNPPISLEPVSYYPVFLDLAHRPVVVVGGGKVAVQKAAGLIAAGADVTVVSPDLDETLAGWHAGKRLAWIARHYHDGDLEGAFLAITTTEDRAANRAVWEEAQRRRIPINAADDPTNCSYILPAIHRDGDLVVAVSTGGKAPAVAMRVRDQVAAVLSGGYGRYLDLLGAMRHRVFARYDTFEERRQVWHRIARSSALDLVRSGDEAGAEDLIHHVIGHDDEPGDRVAATRRRIARMLERPGRTAISCSFQSSGLVLLHMIRQFEPDIPVLFVDTGYHFEETLAFRDRVAREWNLNLVVVDAGVDVAEHEATNGLLYGVDPTACCEMRKVDPLYRALDGYDTWLTGLRRDQSHTRADTRTEERKLLPSGRVVSKLNPLVDWASADIDTYVDRHDIPRHPLYDDGYPSIGCAPCTQRPVDPDDRRSGRWDGRRLECGIHTKAGDLS